MTARRKVVITGACVVAFVMTVAVVSLWADILSDPLGRQNAVAMLRPLVPLGLASVVLGNAIKDLPTTVRPTRPYMFAIGVLVALWLVIAGAVAQ